MNVTKPRNWYYKILPIARREIGMDEEAYREMLSEFGAKEKGGKPSASTMSIPQMEQALSHLKECGFKPKRTGVKKDFREAQIAKCKKLWDVLHEGGVMRQPYSEATLSKFAYRTTKVNNIRWADSKGLTQTIEALKGVAKRERIDVEHG